MEFKSSKKRVTKVDPFSALMHGGTEPVGPGIGTNRPAIFEAPRNKRRTPGKQVFGDTPMRDGPFAQSAEPLATNFPTSARKKGQQRPSGPNPFNNWKPK